MHVPRDVELRVAIAVTVARLRELEGLSIRDLAERAGLAPRTVWAVEHGKDVQVSTLARVADALCGLPRFLDELRVSLESMQTEEVCDEVPA